MYEGRNTKIKFQLFAFNLLQFYKNVLMDRVVTGFRSVRLGVILEVFFPQALFCDLDFAE
jgi:hypothetical protein